MKDRGQGERWGLALYGWRAGWRREASLRTQGAFAGVELAISVAALAVGGALLLADLPRRLGGGQ